MWQLAARLDQISEVGYSTNIESLLASYQWIIDGYLKGCDLENLAKAIHQLCNSFDGPILDRGL